MLVSQLIAKKKRGEALLPGEIDYLIQGFTNGGVPDYQMSALLMAIHFRGLTDEEGRRFLTAMIASGDRLRLESVPGTKVDKHSTGGVGDKTSLIIAPVVASAGVPVPMISGRALGHTGGTLDKLESIPGFRVRLSEREFERILREHGCAFGAQTDRLVPADRKLYALRDVTATVSIPPLIAASILSKKIAEGTNALVMDVKVGRGGFLGTQREAEELSKMLVEWSAAEGVRTVVLGTDMDQPLGCAAGNRPEVLESIDILRTGEGDARLIELCALLGGAMLMLGGKATDAEAGRRDFLSRLRNGDGLRVLESVIEAQGGDPAFLDSAAARETPPHHNEIRAERSGYVTDVDPRQIGIGLVDLGAGRRSAGDGVDHAAGVLFAQQRGDQVQAGDLLATVVWSGGPPSIDDALGRIGGAFTIGDEPPAARPLERFRHVR